MKNKNINYLKQDVVKYAKLAQEVGLCQHRAGNFSARDKESGLIAITPSAVNREDLTTSDIIVMDQEGNIVENDGGHKPSSESMMHLSAYKSRPEVNAVVHTHSVYATSFAIVKKQIPAIVYEINTLGLKEAYIPVAEYGRPGTPDLAKSIVDPLKIADAILLEKHGVLTVDSENLYEAYLKAIYVEDVAQLYFNSLLINGGKEVDSFEADELSSWKYPSSLKI